ncbi:nitric-oxide reductase large subunit [Sphingomonas sp. MAH-20]|uniref:Nitric-oxide reductase large subunit n=1 Tax=Sphingomonas horti TaxID=2682842 RepID=A0A6I4J0Q7_9SPHN|nr:MULTISPECIES: nitric-oxide reductase large subunit [Sphingomonas]MBA2919984.1 nitric-oxide reductase large subunit [Sphingomonas sp. CGMCC 1.13658]MVO77866.1 nitric-oxide reductase large subunit [Sphingomonas horti]
MEYSKKLWLWLGAIFVLSFAVLGLIGREIYVKAPPVPEKIVSASGQTIYTRVDIETGREVWQTLGGMQLGSVWGHGGYVAPDWGADWLHREALTLLDVWAREKGAKDFAALNLEDQAALKDRLKRELRTNGYDASTGAITVSDERAQAMAAVGRHYASLFSSDPALKELRVQYAIPEKSIVDAKQREQLGAFFFWTSWTSVTNRPDDTITYTNNWPHEPLVGNTPSASLGIWSIASVLFLIAGIGWLLWYQARRGEDDHIEAPAGDPFLQMKPTPSMRATTKYFVTVLGLFLAQVLLGAITAHYAVEGQDFYGFQISELIPYALTRTWHTQLGIFWIATAWLATGLYVAPMLSNHEPKFQRLGVNVLWVALLVVVIGSFAGEWMAIQQKLGHGANFWFGHMGYEFVDLGRFWAILLFVGLMIWLTLVGRALWPALKRPSETRGLIGMVFVSTIAIGLFFGAALTWGRHSPLSMIEYFRWWVVHLWVEGFFEVFATAVIALIFAGLGLVRARAANTAVVFSTAVFLTGGILGTLHHLYFSGTTTPVIAWGAMFSALEVVPLALLGVEAFHNYRMTKAAPWVQTYKWPILFFVAVSFWNLVGAGILGFSINPPISLYYIQGLNMTPSHGHAALFGVYGMLGVGLMLFCLRTAYRSAVWSDAILKPAFWTLNIGLAMMVFLSLVPAGIYQSYQSITHSFWYARSPEIVHGPVMETLVWMRVPGDIVFSVGPVLLAVFMLKLLTGRKARREIGLDPSLVPAE